MEYLFSAWQRVSTQLLSAKRILLLADYDGTLTPIAPRPELATLPENTRRILQTLVQQEKVTVGVISGRELSDLESLLSLNGVIYAGNHGLEIKGSKINYTYPLQDNFKALLPVLHPMIEKALCHIDGVIIENKGLTLSVHYRQVDENHIEELENTFTRVLAGLTATDMIRVTRGKKVLEVRPATNWNKGKAVQIIMKRYGSKHKEDILVPIYLGDDLTDEDAFSQINKYQNGITVFVGEEHRMTKAHYYIYSPDELTQFFTRLLELVGGRSE